MAKKDIAGPGFLGKPLIEKLKLIVLFALIGALIFFSRPRLDFLIAGAVLTFIGAMIRVWAAGHLTRDQRLTTSGPYQYTRNPFYLGRLCVLIGFALMSGLQKPVVWAIFLLGLGFFFLGYMPRKERREGGRLENMFGDDYRNWRDNVPSLFPRLTPYVTNPRPWSRELFFAGDKEYAGNKELPTTIATLVLIALFFIRWAVPH
jgi:protein-S-isoprenylcysteine O-methyltransferase Ste14